MNDVKDMTEIFTTYGETVLHPVAVVFTLCMAGVVLWSRRSRMLLAVVLVCVFVPPMQRVVVFDLDFNMLRLIAMLAWVRVLVRGEYRHFRWERLDLIFVLFTVSLAVIHVLRVGPSGIAFRLGTSFDAFTIYFLFRITMREHRQVLLFVQQLAWIVIALGLVLTREKLTGVNVFAVFGSAPYLSEVREGTVRAQGPFSHALMAGTFGSALIPIFIGVFRGTKNRRKLMAAGVFFATVVTLVTGSSGPLIVLIAGLMGWALWPFRRRTRALALGAVCVAFLLHVVREKPVWHLIGRVGGLTGSTGYHRYRLIDAFVGHFSEWALIGTSDVAYWGYGLQDLTNQYVAIGVAGGLVTLILFLWLLAHCFSRLRRTRILIEAAEGPRSAWAQLSWGFSVSLAAHCVSFISVSYFGQMEAFFYMFLGAIPALSRVRRPAARKVARSAKRPSLQAPTDEPRPVGSEAPVSPG